MLDPADRERAISAYAVEVRSFHAFLVLVLLFVGTSHALVVLPYAQVHGALPAVSSALTNTQVEIATLKASENAIAAAAASLGRFRSALDATTGDLRRVIGNLVARGQIASGPGGDPYKAIIKVPKPGTGTAGAPSAEEEAIPVEEAIRREIGRDVETLSTGLDVTLQALSAVNDPSPELSDALRVAREDLGKNVLALNEVLQQAFADDRGFWLRLNNSAQTLGAASPSTRQVVGQIMDALQQLQGRLTSATALKDRAQLLQARITTLQSRQRDLEGRRTILSAGLGWLPLGLEGWLRIYPIVAAAFALTILYRLRRIFGMRRALPGIDLDLMAPSWLVASPGASGRWWGLLIIALPLIAAIHASVVALADRGLFASVLGDPNPLTRIAFGMLYAILAIAGIVQVLAVTRAFLGGSRKRPAHQAREMNSQQDRDLSTEQDRGAAGRA